MATSPACRWPPNKGETPILFTNQHGSVALVDIPAAISSAQGTSSSRVILSSDPRTEPYPPNEPKTDKARDNLRRLNCDATGLEEHYRTYIRQALLEIRQHHKYNWCFLRRVPSYRSSDPGPKRPGLPVDAVLKHLKSKERENSLEPESPGINHDAHSRADIVGDLFKTLIDAGSADNSNADFAAMLAALQFGNASRFTFHIELDNERGSRELDLPTLDDPWSWESSFSNPADVALELTISDNKVVPSAEFTFYVPPRSTFLLDKVENSSSLRSLIRSTFAAAPGAHPTKVFNFICLDPPWPNSSVARRKNYNTPRYMDELTKLLRGMDLDQYIAPGGYIGVWITNKPAMRKAVLDRGGLFETWNVQLIEEWIYTKTTTKGEPITTLDGLWRKPYEIFLLARAPTDPLVRVEPLFGATWNAPVDVRRRVIVAVPDFHSRKPCLKALVEQWLGVRDGEYEALEIFARYCVKGWWSWGNECLRYNSDMYWAEVEADRDVDMG